MQQYTQSFKMKVLRLFMLGGNTLGGDGEHTFYSSQDGGKTWNSVDANGKDGQEYI